MNITQADDVPGTSGAVDATDFARIVFNGLGMPSAAMLLAVGTSAVAGYALWEQLRFRMYRRGKKHTLPGA